MLCNGQHKALNCSIGENNALPIKPPAISPTSAARPDTTTGASSDDHAIVEQKEST